MLAGPGQRRGRRRVGAGDASGCSCSRTWADLMAAVKSRLKGGRCSRSSRSISASNPCMRRRMSRLVDAVVLQVGQQREDVHGHAVVAAGQAAVDLALVQLGRLEVVEIELFQPAQRAGGFPAPCLRAGVALHLQHAGQLGQNQFLPAGDALLQALRSDDDQPPRLALAGLRAVVGGGGVEGHLAPRRQFQGGEVPAILDDAGLRRPGVGGEPAAGRGATCAGPA